MKKNYPFQRRGSRSAFALSCLLHLAVGILIFFVVRKFADESYPSMGPGASDSNVMQIELQAASAQPEAPPPAPAPAEVPVEEPLKIPDPEVRAEPAVAKPVEENLQQVSSVAQTAQVAQRASATSAQIESSTPLAGRGRTGEVNWRMLALAKLRAMIEAEKYYPPSAQKAGYEGRFRLQVKIGTDGRILSAAVLDGKGHPMLRHALEKIMTGLQGRDIGQTLPAPLDLSFEFEFKLN